MQLLEVFESSSISVGALVIVGWKVMVGLGVGASVQELVVEEVVEISVVSSVDVVDVGVGVELEVVVDVDVLVVSSSKSH